MVATYIRLGRIGNREMSDLNKSGPEDLMQFSEQAVPYAFACPCVTAK